MENILRANGNQKNSRVGIIISDKIDFKSKTVKRDKDKTLYNYKRVNSQEDITIITQHQRYIYLNT